MITKKNKKKASQLAQWWHDSLWRAILVKSADFAYLYGLSPFIAVLFKKLIWARPIIREDLQRKGINLVPANYYSTVPSISEIRNSFEFAKNDPPPYLDPSLFDAEHLREVLNDLMCYAEEFAPPVHGDEVHPAGFFWGNSQFSHSDAMAYYAMIRHLKPNRIVEIGSGFSTLVASEALAQNGCGEIICIEPFPRSFLRAVPRVAQVVVKPVQQLDATFFNQLLGDGDILFIDSTHTVKVGSDCVHLFLRILPHLDHKVMIHVHDVFLPEAMPQEWALNKHIYWTEQYLLLAYLLDNPRAKVWFGSNYHLLMNTREACVDDAWKGATRRGEFLVPAEYTKRRDFLVNQPLHR